MRHNCQSDKEIKPWETAENNWKKSEEILITEFVNFVVRGNGKIDTVPFRPVSSFVIFWKGFTSLTCIVEGKTGNIVGRHYRISDDTEQEIVHAVD